MRFLLRWFTILALLVLITMLGGCSSLVKQGYVGAGAAGGAALGAAVGGPIGAAVGGAAGAVMVGATAEADELRNGTVTGEGAKDLEFKRWKELALALGRKVDELETAVSVTRTVADAVADESSWKSTLMKWGSILASLYFAWRNRAHLLAFGPGYLSRLWHALVGGPVAAPVGAAPAEDWSPPDPPGALPFRERIRGIQKKGRK